MKPTLEFSAALLDNRAAFSDPFFQRFTLREHPVALTETITKPYVFPTLYKNVRCAIGIFTCDRRAAKALLASPKLKPVPVPGGRSLVIFSCYEYRQVMNVPAYNEIAMTIPVLNGGLALPLLPMLIPGYPGFGYHVFHMPVTSRENTLRGQKIWGLPKVPHTIDLSEEDDHVVTVAADENGAEYFRLRVPMQGASKHFKVANYLYSVRDGELVRAQTSFENDFTVTKSMARLFSRGSGESPLTLGTGSYAEKLRRLDIDPQPYETRYTPSMNAAFAWPEG